MKHRTAIFLIWLGATAAGIGATFTTVSFPSGSDTISARWTAPDGSGPFPVVILIHEWWGLNDWVEGKGSELVDQGYGVLAVDLYRGHVTSDAEEAHELMRGLPDDRALRDLSAAMTYLKQQSAVKADRIGVLGWCMGGGFALKLAIERADLAACVVYYGSLPTDEASLGKIQTPVAGFFGVEDRGITVESIELFKKSMTHLGKKVSIRIYEKAGHAFMNDTRPSYNKPASVDSWKRALTFLENHLKS